MNRHSTMLATIVFLAPIAFAAEVPGPAAPEARARGLGVNLAIIGRLIGSGNTLFITSVDVANNTSTGTQVDFYFDGNDLADGSPIVVDGTITNAGIGAPETGTLRAYSNVHFDDFIESLVAAGLVSAAARDHGILGSLFVVFNGFDRRGQGSTSARFENQFGGGTVGVALTGHVVTANEPQALVATIRDTRGKPGTQVYTNLFINNTGLTPMGSPAGPVNVELTARANSTGLPVGNPIVLADIGAGQSRVSSSVLTAMGVPPSEDTIVVFARVTSGNAAIAGVVSIVDPTTQDGSVLEMSRADF